MAMAAVYGPIVRMSINWEGVFDFTDYLIPHTCAPIRFVPLYADGKCAFISQPRLCCCCCTNRFPEPNSFAG